MREFIEASGKMAGSISAVIALLSLILLKPILSARKRRLASTQATKEFCEKVVSSLDNILNDVGDLQCDRLNQVHDYYLEKGYCPTERKAAICAMYKSYHGKGRNHLSKHYENDIMELPDHLSSDDPCAETNK